MKAQDILIALKIQSLCDQCREITVRGLANETGLSISQASRSCHELEYVGLLAPGGRRTIGVALFEFLAHGLKYVFPLREEGISRGMPTGYAADPLRELFFSSEDDLVPVWPDPEGAVRGTLVHPLYKSVPMAAKRDHRLYQYLALVDAIRGGRAREKNKAMEILSQWLGHSR